VCRMKAKQDLHVLGLSSPVIEAGRVADVEPFKPTPTSKPSEELMVARFDDLSFAVVVLLPLLEPVSQEENDGAASPGSHT